MFGSKLHESESQIKLTFFNLFHVQLRLLNQPLDLLLAPYLLNYPLCLLDGPNLVSSEHAHLLCFALPALA